MLVGLGFFYFLVISLSMPSQINLFYQSYNLIKIFTLLLLNQLKCLYYSKISMVRKPKLSIGGKAYQNSF